ncbi:MAG: 3-deoxy-7-phosphoheptulonate synthase [Gammaproteobacteria bacterium]|nr:3-deoxy-7-phosphoheptulonate synthase [Gammaproteobacteria bacterium]MYD80139.1 3-deoxy-7-phosphoheptulonate synthase [Gammaproteobacteria bacterium]
MLYDTDDVRIIGTKEVIAPKSAMERVPISEQSSELIFSLRQQVGDIIAGTDSRLLIVVGPCSIHDPESALEYAHKLSQTANELEDDLCILMRVYFEKPRTSIGWKGLLNDPHLNGSFRINEGLLVARQLLSDISELRLGVATEYLDPITPQYLGDYVSWSAIGARTTESQIHRQLASGLSCPVGFKNTTQGDIRPAAHAVKSAFYPHRFLSVTKSGDAAIFATAGNPDCHIVLRGGGGATNYDNKSIKGACDILRSEGLNHRVMVDMSHANSNSDYRNQLGVCDSLCNQLEGGEHCIMGVMIESHLIAGRQDIGNGRDLVYGQSITDACLGWEQTRKCLNRLAKSVHARNSLISN